MDNLTREFWQYIEHNRDKKICNKIYNWLNGDNLGSIVLDNGVFWIEKTCSIATLPDYIYKFIIKWGKKQGYKYLYD